MLLDVLTPDPSVQSQYLLIGAGVVGLVVLWFVFRRRKGPTVPK